MSTYTETAYRLTPEFLKQAEDDVSAFARSGTKPATGSIAARDQRAAAYLLSENTMLKSAFTTLATILDWERDTNTSGASELREAAIQGCENLSDTIHDFESEQGPPIAKEDAQAIAMAAESRMLRWMTKGKTLVLTI